MKHETIVMEMQLEVFFNLKTFLNIIVYESTMNGSQWNGVLHQRIRYATPMHVKYSVVYVE